MEEKWLDNHPIINDSIIFLLPGIGVSLMWITFGIPIKHAAIQGLLTSVIVFACLLYLIKRHNKNIFRSIDLTN